MAKKTQTPMPFPRQGLSWCPLYKAGSTTWMANMVLLEGLQAANR